jgi:hypothetical protein
VLGLSQTAGEQSCAKTRISSQPSITCPATLGTDARERLTTCTQHTTSTPGLRIEQIITLWKARMLGASLQIPRGVGIEEKSKRALCTTASPLAASQLAYTPPSDLNSGLALRCATNAASSTTGPRAALTSTALGFMSARREELIRWRVLASRLQCRLTTCGKRSISMCK